MQNAGLLHRRPVPPAKIKIKINLLFPCDQDGRKAGPPAGIAGAPGRMEANVSMLFSSSLQGPWADRLDVALDKYMSNPSMLVHKKPEAHAGNIQGGAQMTPPPADRAGEEVAVDVDDGDGLRERHPQRPSPAVTPTARV
jgi:hypothetical protein